jgi:tetratricopeptide (TPR) repeat protein
MHGSEELLPEGQAALRDCLERDNSFGFFVRIRAVRGNAPAGETADLRLFRRRTDLPRLFIGRLHPHFHPDVLEAVKREGLEVGPCDVVLRHHREAGRPDARKLRFNLRLLEAELHERPGQLHYLIEYGRTLLLAEDPRGHDVLAEAAARVAAVRDLPAPPSSKVQVLLEYALGASARGAAGPLSYDDARGLALRWFPDSPNVLWALAQQSFHRRDYADAAEHLRRLLALGRSGAYDRSHGFDPGIVGNEALINLGACYLQMRRFDEAEACLVQLVNDPRLGGQAVKFLEVARKWRQGRG